MPNESAVVMYGATWCPDVMMARRYLDRHGVEYVYRDINTDPEAMAALLDISDQDWLAPTFVLPDGEILANPSIRELSVKLGVR